MGSSAEYKRITGGERHKWHRWGSYVSARSWGTVRESVPKLREQAWDAFPFDLARSRAYRWSEDGIAGFSDERQQLCLALALWNERDPILKERFFGLTNDQGNHGEDVKDYFFYLDALPSYSYLKMVYKYPQVEFPYARLIRDNAVRTSAESNVRLVEVLAEAFAHNRYFDVFIEYAKAAPDDILCRITAVNRADQSAPLHLLPQVWFRNTWNDGGLRPELRAETEAVVAIEHPDLRAWWHIDTRADLLFTDNDSNPEHTAGTAGGSLYTKDGIDYAIVRGQGDRVNPERRGTKCAAHVQASVAPGAALTICTRLAPSQLENPFGDFDAIFEQRQRDADEFYAELQRPDISDEERFIQRAAFAGINWNKNFYHFNVARWLEAQPEAAQIDHQGWRHLDAHDILSIADSWEYPWLAAWDLSFQITTLAIVDPEFAKAQTRLLLSDRYQRSDGALPAFEGDLSTPHPPVHGWAAWHVYHMTGFDRAFLAAVYEPLTRHFHWWLTTQMRQDHLFGGGFLGVDNISLFDRNTDVPEGAWLAQIDGTSWMALFALNLLAMAVELGHDDDALAFLDHFLSIRRALERLWDEDSAFYYDVLHLPDGKQMPLKVRSVIGLLPLTAVLPLDVNATAPLRRFSQRLKALSHKDAEFSTDADGCLLLAALPRHRAERLLTTLFDPAEFHSPFGVRSLSRYHEAHPLTREIAGKEYTLRYEPDESLSRVFGGNSNWRGPVWAPFNQLMAEALHAYHAHFGDQFRIDGSLSLEDAAHDLVDRLIRLFKRAPDGRRPFFGDIHYFQTDPNWRDYIWFYEHFHPDTGEGLGASHQNGWTALVGKLIHNRGHSVVSPRPDRQPQAMA